MNKRDDHEEYKRRIRTLVDRLEKGENFAEDYKQPIDSKSNVTEENQISYKEFKVNEDVALNKEFKVNEDITLKLEGENFIISVKNDKNSPFTSLRQLPPRGVIRDIWKYVERSEDQKFHDFLDILLFILTEYNFDLDPNEIKFLLDWDDKEYEFQFPCFKIHQNLSSKQYWESFGIEIFYGSGTECPERRPTHWYAYDPTLIRYTDLSNENDGGQQTSVYNGHISGLDLKWVSKIPKSIGYLSKLKYLSITDSRELTTLPNSFKNLRNLRRLYFYNTGIQNFPDVISSLPKLRSLGLQGVKLDYTPDKVKEIAYKHHSRKYVREGVKKNDANVLGLLEIIAGISLEKERHDDEAGDYYADYLTTRYDIDDNSHVTNLTFAEDGYSDKYEDRSINYIPEEIKNLKHLYSLAILNKSNINEISYPKSIEPFLKSLKRNDLDGKESIYYY